MKSILQSKEWAQFKKAFNFEIIELGDIFIYKRNLPLGQNFLYLPEVSAGSITPANIEELKKIAKESGSIFVRLELIDEFSDNAHKLIKSFGFEKAFEELQPKWRQIIDLTKSEDEILAEMKQKGRYNIKIAQRSGVKISQISNLLTDSGSIRECHSSRSKSQKLISSLPRDDNAKLKDFYKLYEETIKREKITGRSLKYFETLIDKFSGTDYIKIYIAEYQGEPVAAVLVSFYSGVASYLYGGSSRRHKEVMAPYLLHFKIMQDAKACGMKSYDLLGRSAPTDTKSSWAGLTRFKEQFGGRAVEILGSYDFVNKKTWYQAFRIAEKMRRR